VEKPPAIKIGGLDSEPCATCDSGVFVLDTRLGM
jgi:hypothetical protein